MLLYTIGMLFGIFYKEDLWSDGIAERFCEYIKIKKVGVSHGTKYTVRSFIKVHLAAQTDKVLIVMEKFCF